MAIIACKECTREVSDKAACCPHCGVSIAGVAQREPRRVKPWLYGMLIAGVLAWGALTTLWLTAAIPVPKQLVGLVGSGSGLFRTAKAPEIKGEPVSLVATPQSAFELKPVNGAVYRTSAEQLYQDYDANEVAIQSKIGDSPIRVSGSVAEINEDTSGHPVVTLHAGRANRADLLLTDDQRSAAAQLSKEDAVEIQCNKMQRIAARLHGSGCSLVLVDAGTVYLAVSLSGKAGSAPLYIVGPMSRKTCLASSDTIAVQVTSNPRSDRILSKSCAATARESVSLEGCHLSSTMSAIPDIPTAHLWKYDCMASAETRRAAVTSTPRRTLVRAAAPLATAAIATLSQPTPAPTDTPSDSVAPTPKAPQEAASGVAVATLPEPVPIRTVAAVPPAPALEGNAESAGRAALATARAGDAGSPPQPIPATAPSSPSTTPTPATTASLPSTAPTLATAASSPSTAPTPPTAVADDLVPVRTKDPDAADRIASYCNKITSGATNLTTVVARCRREEMDAWTRLIVQNEFPTLDETSRRKCKEPPFPDSFVARESCAKYQLHLD
jgi:tRNA_anti-like